MKSLSATITIEAPWGQQIVELCFEIDGQTVFGTMNSPGEAVQVHSGFRDGNSLRWQARLARPEPAEYLFEGTLDGAEIAGWVVGPRGRAPFKGKMR